MRINFTGTHRMGKTYAIAQYLRQLEKDSGIVDLVYNKATGKYEMEKTK